MHAVVFDVDGTLLQSAVVDDVLYKESVQTVLGPVRFRRSLADYDRVTDAGILLQVLEDNSIAYGAGHAAAIKSAFLGAFRSYIRRNGAFPEIPGARAFVQALRASDTHAIAIATGGWREIATLKLESSGFDVAELPLATSDDAVERIEIMQLALSKLGRDFESVTYYGDGPWDRAASERLGWRFVAVGRTIGGIESYPGAGDSEK